MLHCHSIRQTYYTKQIKICGVIRCGGPERKQPQKAVKNSSCKCCMMNADTVLSLVCVMRGCLSSLLYNLTDIGNTTRQQMNDKRSMLINAVCDLFSYLLHLVHKCLVSTYIYALMLIPVLVNQLHELKVTRYYVLFVAHLFFTC